MALTSPQVFGNSGCVEYVQRDDAQFNELNDVIREAKQPMTANAGDRVLPPRRGPRRRLIAIKRTAITVPSPMLRYVSCGIALMERMIHYPVDRYIGRRVDPALSHAQPGGSPTLSRVGKPARDNWACQLTDRTLICHTC